MLWAEKNRWTLHTIQPKLTGPQFFLHDRQTRVIYKGKELKAIDWLLNPLISRPLQGIPTCDNDIYMYCTAKGRAPTDNL